MTESEELVELRAYKKRAEAALKVKDLALLRAREALVGSGELIDKMWQRLQEQEEE